MAHNTKAGELYTRALQNVQRVADKIHTLPQWPSTINCEVLTEGITNVIEYHRGFKVYIHNIWERDQDMNVQVVSEDPLMDEIKDMNDEVVQLTPEVKLAKQPEPVCRLMLDKLDELFGLCNSLRDAYITRTYNIIMDSGYPDMEVATYMVDYIFKNNPEDLRTLKKMYGNGLFEKDVLAHVKSEVMKPFDDFDMMVGEIVIACITPQSENVLQNELMDKMNQAMSRGLIDSTKFQKQMNRWEVTGYRLHSMEGIVVDEKYRFTGPFGPVNQIMGCIKKNAER